MLDDPHPEPLDHVSQPPGQAGRVDQRDPRAVPAAREIGGGAQLAADGGGVQELAAGRSQPLDLVRLGGHEQVAGAPEVAVDGVVLHGFLDVVEILQPEPVQLLVLVGEARSPVGLAVGQAGRAESAVATGRGPADPLGVDQQHVAGGVALLRPQRRPQPGVAGADHREVGRHRTGQRGPGGRPVRRVQPVRRPRCGSPGGRHLSVVGHARSPRSPRARPHGTVTAVID